MEHSEATSQGFTPKSIALELGDRPEDGTILPIQKDGVYNPKLVRELRKNFPERYEAFVEAMRYTYRVTDTKSVKELEGMSLDPEFVKETRRRIIETCQGLGADISHDSRAEKAEAYCRQVNHIFNNVIRKFFPGHAQLLAWRNSVKDTNDLGMLFAMAWDHKSWDNKVRYQAKLKFRLAQILTEVKNFLKRRQRHLGFFSHTMDDLLVGPDGKRGETTDLWLTSTHDFKNNNETTDTHLSGESPHFLLENQLCEALPFRSWEIELDDGTTKAIRFMIDTREKEEESIILKWLRHPDRSLDDMFRDFNGVRIVFENEEDIPLFKEHIVRALKKPHPRTGKMHEVKIDKPKTRVGGNGEDKSGIPCDKFNLMIGDKDYEIQGFTLKDYCDYFARLPDAWPIYEVRRFFDKSLSETFVPDAHNPGLPREKIQTQAEQEAYHQHWADRQQLPICHEGNQEDHVSERIKAAKEARAQRRPHLGGLS